MSTSTISYTTWYEVLDRVVEVTVRQERVHDDDPEHGGEETKGEVVRVESLLHGEQVLSVSIVAVDGRLRERKVVQNARGWRWSGVFAWTRALTG